MAAPHAPRRSLFAVWRWPRRAWIAIVPLILLSYFLMPPITTQIWARTGLNPTLAHWQGIVEYPLTRLRGDSKVVLAIYQEESELIDRVFGPAPVRFFWSRDAFERYYHERFAEQDRRQVEYSLELFVDGE